MATRVTMRIFSGRPNPVRVFTGAEEDALLRALAALPVARAAAKESQLQRVGGLGFRGFLIEPVSPGAKTSAPTLASPVSLYGGIADYYGLAPQRQDLRRIAEYRILDIFILGVEPEVAALAKKESQELYDEPNCRAGSGPSNSLQGRPAYAPAPWNGAAAIASNNCYNYANNHRFTSGAWARPGAGGGQPASSGACSRIRSAAEADGLTRRTTVPSGAMPGGGWPVALFIKPGHSDFHFYRQDKSGRWSHKPGAWPVRKCDQQGAPILNVQTADTLDYVFCGFLETDSTVVIAR